MLNKYQIIYNRYKRKTQSIKFIIRAVSLLGGFILAFSLIENFLDNPKKQLETQNNIPIQNEKLKIGKFNLESNNQDFKLKIKSKEALQRKKNVKQIILNDVSIEIDKQQKNRKFLLKTNTGLYKKSSEDLEIKTDFQSYYGKNSSITGKEAKIKLNGGLVWIKEPVLIFDEVRIKAEQIEIDYKKHFIDIQKQVEVYINGENNAEQKSVYIKSEQASLYPDESKIIFYGNSKVKGIDWQLQAKNILVEIDTDKKAGFKNIYAINNSSMKRKGFNFTADHLHYDKLANIVKMHGNARVQADKIDVEADVIEYDFNRQKLIFGKDKLQKGLHSKKGVRGSIKDVFDRLENAK